MQDATSGSEREPAVANVQRFLQDQENKSLLRFLTCGSVDDGKSTLIGRLLFDTKLIFEDQLAALERDSRRYGTTGDDVDFALLVDGLEAEREQGITIDVAYRFFATATRKFIVADTPGHEQYTRNMATGASTADLAIVLVDARKGVLQQTRRHSFIASLLGIRHVVLAVNKIDLTGYDQSVFEHIADDYAAFAEPLGFATIRAIPVSARHGDNVTSSSPNMPWYEGPDLLAYLEAVPTGQKLIEKPFRLPVQYVNRPDLEFRGYCGFIASGQLKVGDQVAVANSGNTSVVSRLLVGNTDSQQAFAGQSVTVLLKDEIDISRGSMLCDPKHRPRVADQFEAKIIWFGEHPMIPGRSYILRTESAETPASVTALKHRIDVNTFAHEAVKSLRLNDVASVNLATQAAIAFDPYTEDRTTGAFVLIDRMTNATVAAGMIDHDLRRASNIHWQSLDVTKALRGELKQQKPVIVWFTGLSGSGKSTIANLVEKQLLLRGLHTYTLDGDNIRHGLNRDLGFTEVDRVENIRRVGEVARLFVDAGLITLVSFISPFRAERRMVRDLVEDGEFVEVFVDTPLEECARRDPKGLYAKASSGEIRNFTGIDSPYEPPDNPEITIRTMDISADESAATIIAWLMDRGHF